jgi:hypothetical protein
MATIATLSLADGQATPVTHTFTPVGIKNAIATWKDKSGGVPAGYPTITYALREPTKVYPAYKVATKIALPTLETSPSFLVPTKAYECLLSIEAVLPDRCTDQNRKDLYAYGVNLLANAILSNGIKNTEAVWG